MSYKSPSQHHIRHVMSPGSTVWLVDMVVVYGCGRSSLPPATDNHITVMLWLRVEERAKRLLQDTRNISLLLEKVGRSRAYGVTERSVIL